MNQPNTQTKTVSHKSHWYFRAALIFIFIGTAFFWPFVNTQAQTELTVSGWIPWWQAEQGIASARQNMDVLDIIYPFVYEIESGTTITEKSDLSQTAWRDLFRTADREGVAIIPTIAWFNGNDIHDTLRDERTRSAHIDDIVDLVERNRFDGINIDYEKKQADTIDYFSQFLEELRAALPRERTLTCAIEPRTPPERRFRVVPDTLLYANDYTAIAQHCDFIELMTYDQGRADWQLNQKRLGYPYSAIADSEWVTAVLDNALTDFPAEKVRLGIPTYGRVWDVTVAPQWYRTYTPVASLNVPRMRKLSHIYDTEGTRTESGEMVFSYFPDTSPYRVLEILPVPEGTPSGLENAARALLFADLTGREVLVRFATYSDAGAMRDKVRLAERYGLEGVALFKIDGEEDQRIWDVLR